MEHIPIIQDLFSVIILTVVSTITSSIVWYFVIRWLDQKKLKYQILTMLYEELKANAEIISIKFIPENQYYTYVYEGIVSTTNLRFFKEDIQSNIHNIYRKIQKKPNSIIKKELDSACDEINRLRNDHKKNYTDRHRYHFSYTDDKCISSTMWCVISFNSTLRCFFPFFNFYKMIL